MKKNALNCSVAAIAITLASGMTTNVALAQTEGASTRSDDIIITVGTRRDARSAANTPAPIDVISSDEILNQGDSDIQNILRTSIPSYNVNTQPISDAATLIRPANLRGLAPDSTLVLVNGKRRHRAAVITFLGGGISDGSQGPDISVIPTIALKQVEVLRDGAASQYGSDAIAGVINFVLRDASDGASFEASWGQTYEGDGDQYSFSANVGLPINLGEGGFLNLSGEFGEIDATDRSVQRDDAAALIAAGNNAVANPAQIWGQPNVNDDLALFANMAIPASERLEFYAFGNYAERQVEGGFFFRNPTNRAGVFAGPEVDPDTGLVDTADLDMDNVPSVLVGDLSTANTGDCIQGIPLTSGGLIPDPTFLASIQADANCFSFVELFPGGFTPRFGGDLEDKSVALGFRGELGRLTYDISYYYGQSDVDFFINNTINASLGPVTPTSFRPGGYSQIDKNFNADFAYAIPNNLFASDVNFAFGFEHREEEFQIRAGDPASFQLGPLSAPGGAYPLGQGFSSSSNGFGGFTTASAGSSSQSNYAVYGEVEADITEQFILQGAVRYEDFYDSFGDTLNYKIGALYAVNDNLTFRSTYSTGFHAPTGGQASVTNITTQFSGGQLQDQGTLPLSSAAGQFIADNLEATTGVRPTLGPEKSKNFTVGAGFNVGPVNLTVDYFRISVSDRIAISDQQDFRMALFDAGTLAGLTPADMGITGDINGDMVVDSGDGITSLIINGLDANGVINAADFAGSEDLTSFGFFQNTFDTRTQGIDIVASSNFEFYAGSNTKVAAVFNWTDTVVTDRGLGSAAPLSTGRAKQIEDSIPATRGNISLNHYQGKFRGLARVNYYGSFFECHLDATNNNPAPAVPCDLPHNGGAQFTVDLEAAVKVMDRIEFIVGAQNVLDSFPDALSPGNAGVAGAQFPPVAPAGYNGGFFYFKVRVDL